MLDLKMAIKETEKLIAKSKEPNFCQSSAIKEPKESKSFNPFKQG